MKNDVVGKCLHQPQNGAVWDKGKEQGSRGDRKQGNEWGVKRVGGGQLLKVLKYAKRFIL